MYFWEQPACCEVTKRQPGGKIKRTPHPLPSTSTSSLYLKVNTFEYHAAPLCRSETASAGDTQPDDTGLFCVDMTRNTSQTRV